MNNKVCQILFSGLGGHGSVAFPLLQADKEKKWDNCMLFYGNEPAREEYKDYCREHKIPYAAVLKKPGLSAGSYLSVYRFLKQQKPDRILLHSPTLVLVTAWYCLFSKARLILVEHHSNQAKRRSEWICSYLSMFLCKRIVYLTEQYEREVRKRLSFFYRPRKTVIIPNGIDIDLYSPAYGRQEDVLRLTMIARFTPGKDHPTLIDAFSQLQARFPDTRMELCLAGDGQTLAAMKQLTQEKQIPNVVFPGMLDEMGIVNLLKQSDIYVHSTLAETMSTAIMQAMSCGLAVVASDIPGVNNLVNGENGLLFSPQTPGPLKDQLALLVEDPARRTALGQNARQYAVSHLSSDKMFNAYNNLLR
ncbi:glycosyltransferase family 4 protein [Nostoc ellipsosporum NOK]|nr:glycosyltransferase family 4 protein [Nostoc ellipsosporum NOK]